jgi:hypothetical protein
MEAEDAEAFPCYYTRRERKKETLDGCNNGGWKEERKKERKKEQDK